MMGVLSDIYSFNPTCELAVANETNSWQPNRLLRKFETEMECLPAFFATQKDFVLVENMPGDEFYFRFKELNLNLPGFITMNELIMRVEAGEIVPGEICPWGWSQIVQLKFKDIRSYFKGENQKGVFAKWNPKLKEFYSREFSLSVLNKFIELTNKNIFIEKNNLPVKCTSILQADKLHVSNIKSVVKLPWSSSGRGVQFIKKKNIHPSIRQRIAGGIKQQGFIMQEKYLEKRLDFATHFEIKGFNVEFLGISVFDTSEEGSYNGNFLNGYVPEECRVEMKFLKENLKDISGTLKQIIGKSELSINYQGFLGVDGFVYMENNELKIQPCVEINLRYNMGLLAFKLENILAKESFGVFRQYFGEKGGFKELINNKNKQTEFKTQSGKMLNGVLPLTNYKNESQFGAYLEVVEK